MAATKPNETAVEETARAFRLAGCERVYLAGRPIMREVALRQAGVRDFIFSGCDTLSILRSLLVTFNPDAPAGTPKEIVDRMSEAVRAILKDKAVVDKFDALGAEARGSTPDEFNAYLRKEYDTWAPVIKDSGIKMDA